MTWNSLHIETDPRDVVRVTLNMPDKRNVLSAEMIGELSEMARTIGRDRQTRAIILAGAGSIFCAGGDLTWMQAQIGADRAQRMAAARALAEMLLALNTMEAPLIGRVQGGAFGGGIGMACVCDVVLAESGATFCFSETRLGLIPATIGPYVIARIGEGHARRVFMSARVFGAAEAGLLGLVSRVVPAEDLDAAVEAEVAPYLGAAPGAVAAAKRLVRTLGPRIDADIIEATIRQLADIWEQPEAAHGINSFLERVSPDWAK